ncbi:MAG: methyltransferase domain-containing protein [Methanogenium sp.]|nr:methyltransferase domain-containing protein [Methanogenium sp.]
MKVLCPLCSSDNNREIYNDDDTPIFQNKSYFSKEEASSVKKGVISLYLCEKCGFVWNLTFEPSKLIYDSNYQNEQSHSSIFMNHLWIVQNIIVNKIPKGSNIVEIGCGKGTFLELLKSTGEYNVCGYDPAYEGNSDFVKKCYYPPEGEYENADLFIMRHVLEHVPEPLHFLKMISCANDDHGMIYIEIPDFSWIIKNGAFWDISYEHCNYFSLSSLEQILPSSDTGYLFGDQYIYSIGYFGLSSPTTEKNVSNILECSSLYENINFCRQFLEEKSNLAVWGAGAKGANFVRILDPYCKKIKCVVDINPKKQGRYLGGSGHKIISPEEFKEMKDIEGIIIMNENYLEEIRQMMNLWDGDFYILDKLLKKV